MRNQYKYPRAENAFFIFLCFLFFSCKNNQNDQVEASNKIVDEEFSNFIASHDAIFNPKNIAHLTLDEDEIYIGYYKELRNGYYAISITTHPKPYFISHEFFVDTINQNPIVFTNMRKFIFDKKLKYDSMMNTKLSKQLIKDSIISSNEKDAWLIDANDVNYYFKKGKDKNTFIVLDKIQLLDSINKYGASVIDFYEYRILPTQLD